MRAAAIDLTTNGVEDTSSNPQQTAISPSIDAAAAAAKRTWDKEDNDAAELEQAARQVVLSKADSLEFLIQHSAEPTLAVRVSNLTPGVTARCLTDVFGKYGELIGAHPIREQATVVQYQTVEAAQAMWNKNHGQRVVDSVMSINFVHLTTPSTGSAPMDDGNATNTLTISTKDGALPPRQPAEERQVDRIEWTAAVEPAICTTHLPPRPRAPTTTHGRPLTLLIPNASRSADSTLKNWSPTAPQ